MTDLNFCSKCKFYLKTLAMRNWILRDHSDDTLIEAIERNVIEQKMYFASKHPCMDVVVEDDLIIVDSHTNSSLHNWIFSTRWIAEDSKNTIEKSLMYFKEKQRPFSWMVGPTALEDELSEALEGFGLKKIEKFYCMIINLSHFRKRPRYIRGFQVQQVLSKNALRDFESILSTHHRPESMIEEYFKKLSSLPFRVTDPKRLFVGYLDNNPAILGELYLGAGVAGLATFVSKNSEGLVRDLTVDLTAKMLSQAKMNGYHYAIVKCAKEHCYFYNQLGFKKYCEFYLYQ